ncbi:Uncharacterised protein [uncultured archaeon]|nr:Uncharacterised protein [uncultured archaeon]
MGENRYTIEIDLNCKPEENARKIYEALRDMHEGRIIKNLGKLIRGNREIKMTESNEIRWMDELTSYPINFDREDKEFAEGIDRDCDYD